MVFHMEKDTDFNEEVMEAPSFLPRLFVSPSCLPEFSLILAVVADMKAILVKKTTKVQEARSMRDHETVYRLSGEREYMRLVIEALEFKAKEMRKKLVERIYVEVRSVREMKAVNELRAGTGTGATPGMRCFRGKVYVCGSIPKEVMKAIATAERFRETF